MVTKELIQQRAVFLSTLCRDLEQESWVRGFFLAGHTLQGQDDPYSDIDLRLIVIDKKAKRQVYEWLATWSPDLLFIEELNDVNASFYFEHFLKLKVLAYYASELEPSIWFKQIQVIWDPEGMIEPMRQSSLALELSVTQAMIDHYLTKYYAHLHTLCRGMMRGEINYCMQCILMMRNILSALWCLEKGHLPNDIGDWSRYEGARSVLSQSQQQWMQKVISLDKQSVRHFCLDANQQIKQVLVRFGYDTHQFDRLTLHVLEETH